MFRTVVAITLSASLLGGCAAWDFTKSLFITAVSLEAIGVQLAAVSEQVTVGCETRVIPTQPCERYRVFGEHFKRTYPIAVKMWKAADRAGDAATRGKAEDVVRVLAEDMTKLATEALNAFSMEVR